MSSKSGSQLRVAHCDCGAGLAGASEKELFEAAQQHVALAHPQLLIGSESLVPGSTIQLPPAC